MPSVKEQFLHPRRRLLLEPWRYMAVEVKRHRDSAVSKEILHHLRMGALFQQERRRCVSQIVHAQSGKARPVKVVMKRGIYPARIQRPTGERWEYEAMLTPRFTSAPPDVFDHVPVRLKHIHCALRQSNCSATPGCLWLNEQQALALLPLHATLHRSNTAHEINVTPTECACFA